MEIVELLNKYYRSPETQRLRDKFLTPSLFDIIQKDRSETVHSNFLKWLFDLQVTDSSEGFNIISSLIQVSYKRAIEQGLRESFPKELIKAAYGNHMSIEVNERAIREYRCHGVSNNSRQNGIVDLVINGFSIYQGNKKPFKIIIENKVDTEEHNNQTWRYYTFFEGKKSDTPSEIEINNSQYHAPENEDRIYLFLTPAFNPKEVNCSCPHFIKINYQDLMEHCINPLLQCSSLNLRSRLFLEEYSRALSLPYINNLGKNTIMCLNETDKALLKQFWEANQQLISISLEALNNYYSDDKEEIENAINAINALQGKSTKYSIKVLKTGKVKSSNQTNLMYDLVDLYQTETEKTLQDVRDRYNEISSIFNNDKTISGYKWLKFRGVPIGITTQKQRNRDIVEKITALAKNDGFEISN